MIDFAAFSFWYAETPSAALDDVRLRVDEGDLALVVGYTGSGKSTLLRAVNGLVPHASGGHVEGAVTVAGKDPRDHPPRELAGVVGFVGQDPLAGFVTDVVEDELAYGMEQLGFPPQVMRRRVEEVLDLMGISGLRDRTLRTLSGGEQQRVALASVLTVNPRVLVLDEPTSALDPAAAEDALSAVLRLVHDLGVTVLAAEHRLERVVEYSDRLVLVENGRVTSGAPAVVLQDAPLAPPVVELGRLMGWSPLPLSVRDARRRAEPLRARLADAPPVRARQARVPGAAADGLVVADLAVRYGSRVALRGVDLEAAPGEVVALMGRNGSGKSSLLWAAQGSGRRDGGRIRVGGVDPASLDRSGAARLVTLVPQQAGDLLYHDKVSVECAAADRGAHADSGSTMALFHDLVGPLGRPDDVHPRDLSDGQRLALALAVQLVGRPRVLLLDEPTRGLDYRAKTHLRDLLTGLADAGSAVVVATHDVEFAAQVADRVVVLAEGEVVTSTDVVSALSASPVFAPQVAKVLAPAPWLTTDDVRAGLALLPDIEAVVP